MSVADIELLDERLDNERDYWSRKLAGHCVASGLPLDFVRPEVFLDQRRSLEMAFGPELCESLRKVCNNNETLVLVFLLTVTKICLHKYTDSEDITVGTAIHERYRELASFNQVLALRNSVSADQTCKELLLEVKRTLQEAYANQKFSYERVLKLVNAEQAESKESLFNVVVILDDINNKENVRHLKNDVTLAFSLNGGAGVTGSIEYNPSLFSTETIERFRAHFLHLLHAVLNQPETKISELDLLLPDERQSILHAFNETASDYPRHSSIHDLFERQAARTPHATALRCGDDSLTYSLLNSRANQLAHLLRSRGLTSGDAVALLLNHSTQLVVSILAVLKAGAHYLPLDPSHPAERLSLILDDAAPTLLITEASLAPLVPEDWAAPVLLLNECDDSQLSRFSAENLPTPSSEEAASEEAAALAYVIYTSGSTGRPKGVAVTHRSLVNYVCWAADSYLHADAVATDPSTCVNLGFALYSSVAFDLTLTSIYVPLITGHRVEVYARRGPALSLLDVLADDRVEVLKLTPSHLALLLEQAQGGTRLRRLIVGGEALSTDLAHRARQRFGSRLEIYNEYGPTEATVGCMLHLFSEADIGREWVPIGRPAANTQVYVLDEQMRPVPTGVSGEIYIGGECLAQGYLKRPELTTERFIRNPFSPDPEARLYRTGDVARHLAGGVVEYLGRRDEQVKYHGYRVELGELRAAVNLHAQVRDSIVVLRKDGAGRERLVCYYVARQEVSEGELRELVGRRVIAETVPTVYVRLGRMPLTVNGKVNVEALPEPPEREASVEVSVEAELGARPVEELVRGIWCEVLGVGEVGAGDNFFELGGHSLLAGQVAARVRERMGVEVGLRSVFERPTARLLADFIEAELVGGGAVRTKRIEPAGEKEGAEWPLSFSQQRLWFLDRLENGGVAYNVPAAIRLEGALDVEALRLTIDEVVRRHEALRTSFKAVDGQPVQVIHAPRPVPLPLFDLSELPAAEREGEARRLAGLEAQEPFDLTHAPLLRARLLRLSDEEHILLFTMHHIVCDGWSMGVLVKEVSALYEAFRRAEPSPLAELSVQYADYAAWQRQWLQGEVLEQQLDYWTEQLTGGDSEGELPVLELPTDRPRPAVQTFRGAVESFELPAELSRELKRLSRAEGVTLYMTLLAAFEVLLHRYTGQEQVLVGTPSAGRGRQELEGLIGFFVNTLVMRGDLSGDPTFKEMLGRTREAALGAYAHQELPFELLVERLAPERDLSRTPIFQVAFAMQNADAGSLELEGLKLKPLSVESHTSKFDLGLYMSESGQGLNGSIEYSTDLFDADTIERLIGHFRELLEAVVADAERRVADLPILTAPERRQLLYDFNDTEAVYTKGCLHQMFEEQAARTPDANAFVSGEERVTYAELNRRANQLAHYLQACGVGPETRVAICMERSAEMIVGLFGILKAGGAYVPLDLAYPHERLALILENTQAPVLLTKLKHAALFPAYKGRQVWLDADWQTIANEREENPQSSVVAENLAYVIFTSGSTGQPKGVAISHAPAVALLQWAAEVFSPEELSGVLAATSICFDLSIFELFLPLSLGGKFILAENVLHLPGLASAGEVTLINTVPSAMRELLRLGPLPHSVKTVNLAGEALARSLVDALYEQPQVKVVNNLYGPSEDTTYSTYTSVPKGGPGQPTIGRPIANSQLYILDPRMQPVPVGVAGEIYMGGDGLARGYLNRPAATAERFVPDPFGERPGALLYRTGDLARYLPDGQVEYLGRCDQQVKIRGYRIEPGEVEAVLLTHSSVKEALVLVDGSGADKRLVAYVVPEQPGTFTPSDLQLYLKAKLPLYMVPGAYVMLDAMPLTPNGKVDRAAVRREGRLAVPQAAFEAPRTELERTVASVWKELLHVEQVGVNDNFFDLGGHSLLAVQAHGRLSALVGRELSLVNMFQYPTVSSLAEYLKQSEPARPAFEESGERLSAQRQSAQRRRRQRDKRLNAG